jgi:predicted RNA-binding Zn-ribbon protein involved in translation (DUF1610 family)
MTEEKNFVVKYFFSGKFSHQYNETWYRSKFYCLSCGAREVWRCAGMGDYYEGPEYICTGCKTSFHIPRMGGIQDCDQGKQRLKELTQNT